MFVLCCDPVGNATMCRVQASPPHPAIWRPLDKQNARPDLTDAGTVRAGGDQGQPSATAVAMAKAQAQNGETGGASAAASAHAGGEKSSVLVRLPSPELGAQRLSGIGRPVDRLFLFQSRHCVYQYVPARTRPEI